MLTLQKADKSQVITVPTASEHIEQLLTKEWLLTNTRGGYSSSTILACNTRRYHGLLIGSLNPPANRIMALANCMEMLIYKNKMFNLSTFEFSEKFAPADFGFLKQFRRDIGVHFDYQFNGLELTKSVYLLRDSDTVVLVYDFTRAESLDEPVEFALRPLVGLRDFHSLQKSYAHISSSCHDNGLLIRHDVPGSCKLFLNCPSANFEKDPQWWFNFVYRQDKQRGQDFTEDLWTPGFFKCMIDSPVKIVLTATLTGADGKIGTIPDVESLLQDLQKHQKTTTSATSRTDSRRRTRGQAKTTDQKLKTLYLAADQFIVNRHSSLIARATGHESRFTILAGFPWFGDWGRDTFIALPGLLLSTGRFDQAKSVLTTFACAADEGLIPNRFDDNSETAYFNSIDASLWFINAAFQYLEASGDSKTFTNQLLPTIRWIIDSYHNGTKFDIHADDDGLITAGSLDTQLTWMDAKYDGVAFTPRHGKAVEINALWYNSLRLLAKFYSSPTKSRRPERQRNSKNKTQYVIPETQYHVMADKVAESFCRLFWNQQTGCLNDCVLPDGTVDASLRPNQVFAVSLAFSPLSDQQQKSVVKTLQNKLLTPFGLRTLSPDDNHYKGTYTGPQKNRDAAYHQGTVWSFLIGPFIAAFLKVNNFSDESKKKAADFIEPLLEHLTADHCLGQVSEIFDGNAPHQAHGCVAQAWSIAELITAYKLINT